MRDCFLASNDEGVCGPGFGTVDLGNCFDSTLQLPTAAAGSYTLALTHPSNFSFAENYGSGTLGDGFIGLAASFEDAFGNARSGGYAVDITSTAISGISVPELDVSARAARDGAGNGRTLLSIRLRKGGWSTLAHYGQHLTGRRI